MLLTMQTDTENTRRLIQIIRQIHRKLDIYRNRESQTITKFVNHADRYRQTCRKVYNRRQAGRNRHAKGQVQEHRYIYRDKKSNIERQANSQRDWKTDTQMTGQLAALLDLYGKDHSEQTEATSREDHL